MKTGFVHIDEVVEIVEETLESIRDHLIHKEEEGADYFKDHLIARLKALKDETRNTI